MKIEVYNNVAKPKKPVLRLAFKKNCDGRVSVIAVDEKGKPLDGGYLVTFRPNGTIYREIYVNDSLGLDLDTHKRIVLEEE
jgi:hypothetical protein